LRVRCQAERVSSSPPNRRSSASTVSRRWFRSTIPDEPIAEPYRAVTRSMDKPINGVIILTPTRSLALNAI
jgi:hypothetical protein